MLEMATRNSRLGLFTNDLFKILIVAINKKCLSRPLKYVMVSEKRKFVFFSTSQKFYFILKII